MRVIIYWSKREDSLIRDELSGARSPSRTEAARMIRPLIF